MTKEELKVEVKRVSEFMVKTFEESGGVHLMFIVLAKDKNDKRVEFLFPLPGFLMDMRWQALRAFGSTLSSKLKNKVGQYSNINKVDAILMMSEAWVSKMSKEEMAKTGNDIDKISLPSRDPNRIEALTATGSNEQGQCYVKTFEISRPKGQRPVLKPFDTGEVEEGEPKSILLEEFWKGFLQRMPPVFSNS